MVDLFHYCNIWNRKLLNAKGCQYILKIITVFITNNEIEMSKYHQCGGKKEVLRWKHEWQFTWYFAKNNFS